MKQQRLLSIELRDQLIIERAKLKKELTHSRLDLHTVWSIKRQIDAINLRLAYVTVGFPPPPVCTAAWDFNSWAKYYESFGYKQISKF